MSETIPADRRAIRRALVSVSDKTDLVPICQALVDAGIELVSTGSTGRTIAEAGLAGHPGRRAHWFRRKSRRAG